MRSAFELGAEAFVTKHKRLPALVIDGAEFLMESETEKKNDVQFVDELVDLAKARTAGFPSPLTGSVLRLGGNRALFPLHFVCMLIFVASRQTWVDEGVARVVFISSPGNFMTRMRGSLSCCIHTSMSSSS